jgi:hypothetical protein
VRLVSQRLAGRRVRSLCWGLLRFRWGEKQNRDDCVYHALSDQRNLFLIREQQAAVRPIGTGMLALTVAELPLGHHADERLTAIHPFAVRSLPKPVR